jgi:hypothetical protein
MDVQAVLAVVVGAACFGSVLVLVAQSSRSSL